jgi:type IV pilus assembly protein PilQ
MVESGETLVVGGIYEERKSKSDNRVPLLSDIPIIGQLFQSNGKSEDKGELLVFITPSIIEN